MKTHLVIVGPQGAGKSALVEWIRALNPHVDILDPFDPTQLTVLRGKTILVSNIPTTDWPEAVQEFILPDALVIKLGVVPRA